MVRESIILLDHGSGKRCRKGLKAKVGKVSKDDREGMHPCYGRSMSYHLLRGILIGISDI
jgi:hypothetical protein